VTSFYVTLYFKGRHGLLYGDVFFLFEVEKQRNAWRLETLLRDSVFRKSSSRI